MLAGGGVVFAGAWARTDVAIAISTATAATHNNCFIG
jgi:hypothetical protein